MKKFSLIFGFLVTAIAAFAQQPTSNLYQATQPFPVYAPVATAGNSINWAYVEPTVPLSTHDTLRVVTNATFTKIKFDSIAVGSQKTAPLVIMADTVGDTASYSNYPNGKAKVWYKKTPFIGNHQIDELKLFFTGSKGQWTTVKFGANFNCGTLSGDTIHIAKVSTTGGFATATFHFDYQKMQWILEGESTW